MDEFVKKPYAESRWSGGVKATMLRRCRTFFVAGGRGKKMPSFLRSRAFLMRVMRGITQLYACGLRRSQPSPSPSVPGKRVPAQRGKRSSSQVHSRHMLGWGRYSG